mmetsp:Transcript_6098/g.6707  ORF Transcript_6098/g.6707 Transcript_6098/m.6707 type:complete len:207 (-) Transcript_6098:481-1101(-)
MARSSLSFFAFFSSFSTFVSSFFNFLISEFKGPNCAFDDLTSLVKSFNLVLSACFFATAVSTATSSASFGALFTFFLSTFTLDFAVSAFDGAAPGACFTAGFGSRGFANASFFSTFAGTVALSGFAGILSDAVLAAGVTSVTVEETLLRTVNFLVPAFASAATGGVVTAGTDAGAAVSFLAVVDIAAVTGFVDFWTVAFVASFFGC